MSGALMNGPFIGVSALAGALGDDVRVIDLRKEAEFAAAHIPGAARSDYAAGWRKASHGTANRLPSAEELAALLGGLGLAPSMLAVIVPASETLVDLGAAARVFWTLQAAGHERAAILEGGFAAWQAAQGKVAAGVSTAAAVSPYPVRLNETQRARIEDVEAALGGKTALLDARNRAAFEGTEKAGSVSRAGRLPGAMNIDYALAFDGAAGALKSRAELEAIYAGVPQGPVISYCNTGHTAALNWFVLSQVLGRPDVRLYDGSMSEWTADPARPVETD